MVLSSISSAIFLCANYMRAHSSHWLIALGQFYRLAGYKMLQLVRLSLKKYMCVEVKHHKDVGGTIEEWEGEGWRLRSYQVTGRDIWINHYLLFERED